MKTFLLGTHRIHKLFKSHGSEMDAIVNEYDCLLTKRGDKRFMGYMGSSDYILQVIKCIVHKKNKEHISVYFPQFDLTPEAFTDICESVRNSDCMIVEISSLEAIFDKNQKCYVPTMNGMHNDDMNRQHISLHKLIDNVKEIQAIANSIGKNVIFVPIFNPSTLVGEDKKKTRHSILESIRNNVTFCFNTSCVVNENPEKYLINSYRYSTDGEIRVMNSLHNFIRDSGILNKSGNPVVKYRSAIKYHIHVPSTGPIIPHVILDKNSTCDSDIQSNQLHNNRVCSFSNDNFIYRKFDPFTTNTEYLNVMNSVIVGSEREHGRDLDQNQHFFSLISSWSTGTVHGYAQICYIIMNLMKYDYTKYTFLIYKHTQKGIRELVNYFLPHNKIVEIDHGFYYNIKHYYFVSGEQKKLMASYDIQWHAIIQSFFSKHVYSQFNIRANWFLPQSYEFPKKISIVKTELDTEVNSPGRSFSSFHIRQFCKTNGFVTIDGGRIPELHLIQLIHNCEEILTSWGTSFFKNYIHVSPECKRIYNLVLKDSNYHTVEFNHTGLVLHNTLQTYNNAKIVYSLCDKELNGFVYNAPI